MVPFPQNLPEERFYPELHKLVRALLTGERDLQANAANLVAVLYHLLPKINWAGVYWLRRSDLVLGPFQGKPACTRIALNSGVCGLAARERRSIRVDDVLLFPGHIACDPDSRSELVIPLLAGDTLLGVVDLDSPEAGRFQPADQAGLEAAAALLLELSEPRL